MDRNVRMWLLFAILVINAVISTEQLLNYRLELGGLPINLFDALMIIGLALAFFNRERMFPTRAPHPLLNKLYVMFGIAAVAGLIGWVVNGAPVRQAFMPFRNWLALPVEMYLGYYYLVAPKSMGRYLKIQVLAGVIAGTMILLFFFGKGETLGAWQSDANINAYRTIAYVSNYAGIAAALLVYSVASGARLFPAWLALPLAGYCLVGGFATLGRSDWLATVAGLVAAMAMVPKGRRFGAAVRGTLAMIALGASLWIGMYLASRVTGANFFDRMSHRITTILPTGDGSKKDAAYLTRISGTLSELRLWLHNPLMGQGFGAQVVELDRVGYTVSGFYHDTWTSTLCESGLLGFAAIATFIGGVIVVGRRLVRDGAGDGFVLIGALGVITGCHFIVHGLATFSFNFQRTGLVLGIIVGVVLRARAMQRTILESAYDPRMEYVPEEAQMLAPEPAYEPSWS
jgi:hypothetical protein